MKNIHFTENKHSCKTIRQSIIYLMNKYLYNFEHIQKKTTFL